MKTLQGAMLATIACASLAGATARADDAARPVAFRADARVELDAGGKPTRIEVSRDLPEAIRAYVENALRGTPTVRRNATVWAGLR